jgi:hypothetical protein
VARLIPIALADQIRTAYSPEIAGCGVRSLARRFGVSKRTVQRVVRGQWRGGERRWRLTCAPGARRSVGATAMPTPKPSTELSFRADVPMDATPETSGRRRWQVAAAVLVGAFLFNLGQGVLRPTMPLYLQQVFSANYRMVTLIPAVFGLGKWVASLPSGYLLDRLGRRRVMAGGLVLIALGDVGSAMTSTYRVFLSLRALGGVG